MSSIYLELRKEANKRGEHSIRLVIIADRKNVVRRNTGYAVEERYWDQSKQRIKPAHRNAFEWNMALEDKLAEARRTHAQIDVSGKKITAEKIATVTSIGDKFKAITYHFAEKLEKEGKVGTSDRYRSIANQVEKFTPGISAVDMDEDWLEDYQSDMRINQKSPNTIISHARCISAILNKAVASSFIKENRIKDTRKGSYKRGDKQTLTKTEINKLYAYEPKVRWERIAKLAYLFSFYAAGARFTDVLLMPKSALYQEDEKLRMRWQPKKTKHSTGEWVDLAVSPKLALIIKESANTSKTIFGLVDPSLPPRDLDREIGKVQAAINGALKTLMLKMKIAKNISFHCARHGFAQIASKSSGRDVYSIQQALSHDKISTTEIYLGKDQSSIDDLLAMVYK